MKRKYHALLALICTPAVAVCEPVGDLAAFHSAWVIGQQGCASGDPSMIIGALDVFSRIAPRSVADEHCETSSCSALLTNWEQQLRALETETVFLGRNAPLPLPDQTPERFLPARIFAVLPGEQLNIDMPGHGNRAVLVLSGDDLEIRLSDGQGAQMCMTTGQAIFCPASDQKAVKADLRNSKDTTAQVLLLGEPD